MSEWRQYLGAMGKYPITSKIERRQHSSGTFRGMTVEETLHYQFAQVGEALPVALRAALKNEAVNVPAAKLDRLTLAVWVLLASVAQSLAAGFKCAGPLTPSDDGDGVGYPEGIRRIASKIQRRSGVKSEVEATPA